MGKYDDDIKQLFSEGMGGRLIATKLGINLGTVSKRMKALGLNSGKKNQNDVSDNGLDVEFTIRMEKLRFAAEHYARYLFLLCGYEILNPDYYDTRPYDFQFYHNGWKRIQVKTSHQINKKYDNGNCLFNLYKSRYRNGKMMKECYNKTDVDYFFLHDVNSNSWLVPFKHLGKRKTVVPATTFPNFLIDLDGGIGIRSVLRGHRE